MATIINTIRWADNTEQLRRNLSEGLNQIEAVRSSADKMAKTLGGDNLLRAAHNFAAAVEKIGGVEKLTNAERERGNALLEKTLAKYEALGLQAPKSLQDLAAATKTTENAWQDFVKGFDIETAIANPLQTAKGAIIAFAETLGPAQVAAVAAASSIVAVGVAAFGLARKAAAVGAELDDLADKTGLSVPALSRLSNAAQVAGTDLGKLTDAVFKLQKGIGEDSEKVAKGLGRIGLTIAQLEEAGPDRFLELVAAGFAATVSPSERAAAAMEIFRDRTGDMIPTLLDLDTALKQTADITPWTKEQAADAERFEVQLRSLKVHAEALAFALGRDLIPAVSTLVRWAVDAGVWLGDLSLKVSGLSGLFHRATDIWTSAAAALRMFRGEAEQIPEIAGDSIKRVAEWKQAYQAMGQILPSITGALADEKQIAAGLTGIVKDTTEAHTKAAAEMKKAAEEAQRFRDSVQSLVSTAEGARKGMGAFGALMPDLSSRTVEFREQLTLLASTTNRFSGGMTITGDTLHHVVIPAFSTLPNVVPQATKAIKEAGEAAEKTGTSFASAFKDILSGNFSKGFADLGKSLKAAINPANILNTALGGLLEKGISALLGLAQKGLTSLWNKLTGNTAERQVNPIREAFVQAAGGLDALNRKAHEAGVTLAALLDAKTPEAYKKAIDDLTAAFDFQASAMADLDETVKRYGFTIEELGPAFRRQQLDKQAQALFKDFKVLTASGIDIDTVIKRMGGSIQSFVNDARKTGTEIPKAMQPIIQRMIELGLLTDENGIAFGDLESAGLTFSETMTEGFNRIIASVEKLTDAILRGLGLAFESLPASVDVDVRWRTPGERGDGRQREVPTAASGGIVRPWGIQPFGRLLPFRPRGTDTVPALLTPGEMVFTQPQLGQMLSGLASSATGTSGPASVTNVFEMAVNVHPPPGTSLADMEAFAPAFKEGLRRDTAMLRTTLEGVTKTVLRDRKVIVG